MCRVKLIFPQYSFILMKFEIQRTLTGKTNTPSVSGLKDNLGEEIIIVK